MKRKVLFQCTLCLSLYLLIQCSTSLIAQVAINDDGGTPDPSAMLDIKSDEKGLLIPRLTTTQRNTLASTAVAGLMVYDTNLNKFFFFNGVTWDEGSTGGLWSRNGTDTYLTNYNDAVGIGTSDPYQDFDIVDSTSSSFLSIRSLQGYAGIYIDKYSTTSNSYIVWRQGGTNKWYTGLIKNNDYAISKTHTSADGTFYIKESGEVGIGTTDPDRNLEVVGSGQIARIKSTTDIGYLEFVGTATTDWAIGTELGSMRMRSSTDGFTTSTNRYFFGPDNFHPFSNDERSLGISTYRWSNIYSIDGNFSGDVNVNRLTAPLTIYDGTSDSAIVYINPMATASAHNSTLFLAEDNDATYGMCWTYNGGTNNLALWGVANPTHYGPHLLIKRNTGEMALGGIFATGYKLSVDGKIICEELRVDLSAGWPDYVFGKGYKLMSVKELDSFIQANGHLPNIPAAEEIEESGLEVGEMQRLMMEKIEELSLYIIEQQKEIENLKSLIHKNQK